MAKRGRSPEREDLSGYKSLLEDGVVTRARETMQDSATWGKLVLCDWKRAPASLAGSAALDAFLRAWSRLEDPMAFDIVFHGSPEGNVERIAELGLDPRLRKRQALGPGEYFSKQPQVAHGYACNAKHILLFVVLTAPSGATLVQGDTLVIHKSEHQLPLFVLTIDNPSPSAEDRIAILEKQLAEEQQKVTRLEQELRTYRVFHSARNPEAV